MSIPAYKKEAKERAQKAVALRNKLDKLSENSHSEGKEAKLARRTYEHLINSTPYVSWIYTAKVDKK
jgi:hypothetical protein